MSQSIYVFATISLADHYHNIAFRAFMITDCYRRYCAVKAYQSFSSKDCVCYPKREQFKLLLFSFRITHTIFTRETLTSLYKNIPGNSLFRWIPCQQYYGNGLQVILLEKRKCFGTMFLFRWKNTTCRYVLIFIYNVMIIIKKKLPYYFQFGYLEINLTNVAKWSVKKYFTIHIQY